VVAAKVTAKVLRSRIWPYRRSGRRPVAPCPVFPAPADRDFEVKARYRVPPVWADVNVSLLSQDNGSTAIRATISVLPNLFPVVTVPERRIFARFTGAMRKEGALLLNRPAPAPVATDQMPAK
jgi:hypothetical protein